MNIIKGRNNFALTVFVPSDCPYNCSFCTSKGMYKNPFNRKQALESACEMLKKYADSPVISDVVFTGGEPMMDIEGLQRMIDLVPNKNVYINTLLLEHNLGEFVQLVNNTPQVKGISVSRHGVSRAMDIVEWKTLNAPDDSVSAIQKNVRINIVLPYNSKVLDREGWRVWAQDILERWEPYGNVSVNFRADYTTVYPESLHLFTDNFMQGLASKYQLLGRTYCDVCDTSVFKWTDNRVFTYHRGLEHSSIQIGDTLIVNDAIMRPVLDGENTRYEVTYDWGAKDAE